MSIPISPPVPYLVDAKVARQQLSMGERQLWALSQCGAIPSYKVGRSRRYCPDELQRWVRAGCPTTPGSGLLIQKGAR
jgi:hypothetical protein